MMENLDPLRLARLAAGAAILAGLTASITSCGGSGSNAPPTIQSPTTTTMRPPTPGALPAPAPTEKSGPVCGELFTPTVLAPAAIPGTRENAG
ncbi:hypothetical protein DVS77_33285 [Mycolicibacterium moriokaense]|nr:hypothetical protein DVS77_33285 [Mycolicibacterium moriokaense]